MKKVHFIIQGKGGAGKSVIAAILAQYYENCDVPVLNVDTDPVNSTFLGYEGLDVRKVDIMDNGDINPRHFDKLVELIGESDQDLIIDTGSSAFVSLSSYLVETDIPNMLKEMDCDLVIHIPITGGQAMLDTLNGMHSTLSQFPDDCRFIIWKNLYWGPIEVLDEMKKIKTFDEMQVYTTNKEKISAIVEIPKWREATFGHDLGLILKGRTTFKEAFEGRLGVVQRQRLKIIRNDLFARIDAAELV